MNRYTCYGETTMIFHRVCCVRRLSVFVFAVSNLEISFTRNKRDYNQWLFLPFLYLVYPQLKTDTNC